MFALTAGNARTGQALANPERVTQGPGTHHRLLLALAVLLRLVLKAMFGAWRADPLDAGVSYGCPPGMALSRWSSSAVSVRSRPT
jgi:hypothetical protein